MPLLGLLICIAALSKSCAQEARASPSGKLGSQGLLRGSYIPRSGRPADDYTELSWAAKHILHQTLGSIAAGDDIFFSNATWQFETLSSKSAELGGEAFASRPTQEAGHSVHKRSTSLGQEFLEAISAAVSSAFTSNGSEPAHASHQGQQQATAEQQLSAHSNNEQSDRQVAEPVPGVVAIVYEDFFSKASEVALKLLKENFKKVQLKTASATAHIPVVGDFVIKLKDVKLTTLDIDSSSTGVSLGEDGTFVLLVNKLAAAVEGHFQWRRTKFPYISGGCQVKVTAEDGDIQLRVGILEGGKGRPQIGKIQAPDLDFGNIDIQTSDAKLAWLYNAVATLAHDQIQAAIIKEVSKQVKTTVPDQINVLLQGIPTTVEVKGLQLNTSLVQDPEVTPDRLIVRDWGRFKNPVQVSEDCPFVSQADLQSAPILPGGSPYMLIANLDKSIANCLTWDLYRQGKLSRFLVGDDVPQQALYTDTWRFVIPEVYIRCPGCPMALNATVTSAPVTSFDSSEGIQTEGTAQLSFFMAEEKGSLPWTPMQRALLQSGQGKKAGLSIGEHLFTLSLKGQLTVQDLRLEPDLPDRPDGWRINLAMKVNESALAVDVVESDVGPINKAALHVALTVAAFLVEDEVNKGILKDGFPLPDIPHVKVERANVTVANNAIALGTDLSYVQ